MSHFSLALLLTPEKIAVEAEEREIAEKNADGTYNKKIIQALVDEALAPYQEELDQPVIVYTKECLMEKAENKFLENCGYMYKKIMDEVEESIRSEEFRNTCIENTADLFMREREKTAIGKLFIPDHKARSFYINVMKAETDDEVVKACYHTDGIFSAEKRDAALAFRKTLDKLYQNVYEKSVQEFKMRIFIHYYAEMIEYEVDEEGNAITYVNENGKVDWWVVGGRWENYIPLNKDAQKKYGAEFCNYACVRDIDFGIIEEKRKKEMKFWEVAVEGKPIPEGEKEEDYYSPFKKKYYLNRYVDKEGYADEMAAFSTYAIVDTEGEWQEPGSMCMFGCSSASDGQLREWHRNYYKNNFQNADPDTVVVIVDCHC